VTLETGTVVALTVQPADRGDTASMTMTLTEAGCVVTGLAGAESGSRCGWSGGGGQPSGRGTGSCGQGIPLPEGAARAGGVGRGQVIAEPERKRQHWRAQTRLEAPRRWP